MQKQTYSVCIRCGKTRIFSRKWLEKGDHKGPPIFHEESVCPDPECQKIVDEKFRAMRERRELSEDRKKGIIIAKAK